MKHKVKKASGIQGTKNTKGLGTGLAKLMLEYSRLAREYGTESVPGVEHSKPVNVTNWNEWTNHNRPTMIFPPRQGQ